MNIQITGPHKSISAPLSFALPDFCVITGKNGSGKSHLLEVLSNRTLSQLSEKSAELAIVQLSNVQLIGFGALNPQISDMCSAHQASQQHKQWWAMLQQARTQAYPPLKKFNAENVRQFFAGQGLPHIVGSLTRLEKKTGKSLDELEEQDFLNLADAVPLDGNGLFLSQFATVFKVYQDRFVANRFNDYQNKTFGEKLPVLSDSEFVEVHGLKPWELVNDTLAKAGLKYRVNAPALNGRDADFRLQLTDPDSGVSISVNDLSTGEKVLMCLALAVYNTKEGAGRPQVLLLDEPDAPLHPEFSKVLIDVLRDTIVAQAKVKVIMTTHSPSTVALCPEGTVFEMDRIKRIPVSVRTRRALDVLTQDIPNLRVSVDRRRQVFVEGKNDVRYYDSLFSMISRHRSFDFDLLFLEPNSSTTSNCTDVLRVANALADCGNDLVRGIIDWDGSAKNAGVVTVLGDGRRYAIDNYVLDPLFVALALIKAAKAKFSDFDVMTLPSYLAAAEMTVADAQLLVNAVLRRVGLESGEVVAVKLLNGSSLNYPVAFLHCNGHKYEEKLISSFPELHSISRGKGEAGLKLGVMNVLEDFSHWLPDDLMQTFLAMK